jgi:hypothetical protein
MQNRSGRIVLKTMLVAINLVFFATQVSYKFYACSSVPLRQSSERKASKTLSAAGDAFMSGSADGKFLSLDKRYDSKHIFALLPLLAEVDPPLEPDNHGLAEYKGLLFIPPTLIPSQRGPPAI